MMLGAMFYYGGDELGGRILSWFQLQLKAIETLMNAGLPEAVLVVVYSGIDSFGLLAAPAGVLDTSRTTYKDWCEKYILPRLAINGIAVTAVDLYAARCGVLHTSTPVSSLERKGEARQIFYRFKDKTGFNMMMVARQEPICVDVEDLAVAFKEGGIACITELNSNPPSSQLAYGRAQQFLRWGTVMPSNNAALTSRDEDQ
jgi:hypothetical protein